MPDNPTASRDKIKTASEVETGGQVQSSMVPDTEATCEQPHAELPHADKYTMKFDFLDAEPPHEDGAEEQRPEMYETSYHWRDENRTSEQKDSAKGASYYNDAKDEAISCFSRFVNPAGMDWSRHNMEVAPRAFKQFWQKLRTTPAHYSHPMFAIESLKDDYSKLFVRMVLDLWTASLPSRAHPTYLDLLRFFC